VAARLAEEQGATFLDVRPAPAFGAGHVPGSVNVGLGGQFASWAGTLLPAGRSLLLVGEDESTVREAVTRLARVGLESVVGYLQGGVVAWDRAGRPLGILPQITVDELKAQLHEGRAGLQVVDVRRPGEYSSGHVPAALSLPLDRLEREASQLDAARPTAVICAGGYRSSAATSLLRRHGFADLSNVVGGTSAWIAAGYQVEKATPGNAD
jgi:hydroxyacylglutathione hydrolase